MQAVLGPCRVILQRSRFRWLLLCLVLAGLASSFVLPFFSLFATREVGMRPLVFSAFLIGTSLSAVVTATLLARWSDTWLSRRAVLVISCCGGMVGYAGYAVVRDPVGLFVIGCGVLSLAGVTFSQLFALARERIAAEGLPATDAPLYINVFRLMFALSWTVGPALAAATMHHAGFRGTFLGAALCFALLLGCVLRAAAPDSSAPRLPPAGARLPFWQSLQRPGILPHFLGFTLLFCASTMNMLNLPLYVLGSLGGTERHVGLIYSISPAFEIPLMFYFGLLASKGHQRNLILAGAFLAVTYYGALSLVGEPWQIYPLQALAAAIVSITSGIAITFFQDYLPDQPGTATNLFSNASRLGAMVGYVIFGGALEAVGPRGLFLVCTSLCTVTAALFVLGGRRTAALQPPDSPAA